MSPRVWLPVRIWRRFRWWQPAGRSCALASGLNQRGGALIAEHPRVLAAPGGFARLLHRCHERRWELKRQGDGAESDAERSPWQRVPVPGEPGEALPVVRDHAVDVGGERGG